jgi:hypothetical protein
LRWRCYGACLIDGEDVGDADLHLRGGDDALHLGAEVVAGAAQGD